MRTEEEIRERLKILQDKYPSIKDGMPDWNRKEFEAAIWYLKWVLAESEE